MTFSQYRDPAADAALGSSTDDAYTGANGATMISLLKGLFNKPTIASTLNDGADPTQGTTTDTAYTSGAGSLVSLLKGIFARLRGGQATMVNSLPVTLASDQGAITIAMQASGTINGTLQSAATAAGVGSPLAVLGYSACVLTISGSFVGTVTFQGTEDGTNWSNLAATQLGTTTSGATASAPGLYACAVGGLQAVRANITAYTSGAITATAHAVPLASGIGTSGGGAITIADGASVTQGTTTDTAYTSGNGTVVSLLKGIFARLRGGQATMANSLPVTLASDQGAVPVTVSTALPAGENHLGAIGGNTAIVMATQTRPANTTTYASGQVVSNSTTAATALAFTGCARVNAGTGLIVGATLLDQTNQTTKGSYELWLFAGAAAPAMQNDGSAFAPANGDAANLVAVFPFSLGYNGNPAATTSGNVFFMGDVANKPFKCGTGVTTLWGVLVVRNGYIPISGEVYTVTLMIAQD
jgi:hypothetical protein